VWQLAHNDVTWRNTYKMKLSVIVGVCHMMHGLILSLLNHMYVITCIPYHSLLQVYSLYYPHMPIEHIIYCLFVSLFVCPQIFCNVVG